MMAIQATCTARQQYDHYHHGAPGVLTPCELSQRSYENDNKIDQILSLGFAYKP
jgi:hypothetical protein